MPQIEYLDPINDRRLALDFAALVTLIKGSSIGSMAASDDFIELGLTDQFNLRITGVDGKLQIYLLSTLNKEDLPPVRMQIIHDGEAATAQAVEERIHWIRQMYAVTFLIDEGRESEIQKTLAEDPAADLEERLLTENQRLFIMAANEGSFWITVVTKTGAAFRSLSNILPLFYDEGRQALLERVRATTELRKLEVEAKRAQLAYEAANKYFQLMDRYRKEKDPQTRQAIQRMLPSLAGYVNPGMASSANTGTAIVHKPFYEATDHEAPASGEEDEASPRHLPKPEIHIEIEQK
jgi:hypothetical protein